MVDRQLAEPELATSAAMSSRGWRYVPRFQAPEAIGLIVFLAGEIAFFALKSPYFFNWDNWVNIVTNVAVAGVVAAAGTLLLVAGQFDLSVGSGIAFVGMVLAYLQPHHGVTLAAIAAIGVGIGIGILNGFLVTVVGINALIATLGTLAIFRGFTELIGGGETRFLNGFSGLGTARPFGNIPVPALAVIAVAALMFLVMRYTVYGRSMYAIGANPVAARLVGIRVGRAIFIGFVLSGACIALSGLMLASQLGSTSSTAATGLELSVVTAIILGGTSLTGGRGSMVGTVLGLLIIGVLNNGLVLLNVNSFWQDVARGLLLILAVTFDRSRALIVGRRAQ